MRIWKVITTAVAVAVLGCLVAPVPAQAAPYCGITWGSLDKKADPPLPGVGPVVNVRAGQHDCYDRLVVDFDGAASGYSARYVSQVTEDPTGDPVPLRGGAAIELVLYTTAYDLDTGALTYRPGSRAELVNVTGWRTLRQVAWAGSFEGYTTIGVGVRARLPFRVFTLPGPGSQSRLVLDVAHRW